MQSSALLRASMRALALFWCVLTLTFLLLHLAPGDPATLLVPPGATAEDVSRLRRDLDLDRPLPVQYARWLRSMLTADFGVSFADRRPVRDVLSDALPVSAALGGLSLLLSFIVGTATGIFQAWRRGSRRDLALTVLSVILVASPAYWLGLGAIACFTYLASSWSLPLAMRLPAIGMTTLGAELHGVAAFADLTRHAILPVTLLAAIGAAGVARYVRMSALELTGADFVRSARAKGLPERRVLFVHLLAALRASLLTLFALALPGTVAGSVFVETIFGWPGMGRLIVTSIVARDYPVVLACTALFGAIVILANLAADALLPWADPRARS